MSENKETIKSKIKLQKPIILGEVTVEELCFRDATIKDMKLFQKPTGKELDGAIEFIAAITDQSIKIIEALSGKDWADVSKNATAIAKEFEAE